MGRHDRHTLRRSSIDVGATFVIHTINLIGHMEFPMTYNSTTRKVGNEDTDNIQNNRERHPESSKNEFNTLYRGGPSDELCTDLFNNGRYGWAEKEHYVLTQRS